MNTIEIKQVQLEGRTYCSRDCIFLQNEGEANRCIKDWATTRCSEIPGPSCPGPGEYELNKVGTGRWISEEYIAEMWRQIDYILKHAAGDDLPDRYMRSGMSNVTSLMEAAGLGRKG